MKVLLLLVHYGQLDSPGDPAVACGTDCATVNLSRPGAAAVTVPNVRGLVVAAGELIGAAARPSTAAADYLEGANALIDLTYDWGEATPTFNDKMVFLEP